MKKLVGWLVAVKLTRKITKIIKQDHKKEEHKKEELLDICNISNKQYSTSNHNVIHLSC